MIHIRITTLVVALAIVASRPSSAQVTVVGSLVHEQTAAPGGTYDASITLRNDGAAVARVRVYLTDYRFDADGRSEFRDAASTPTSNAAWITLGTRSLAIAPHQSARIPYKVKIPSTPGDSTAGSFWSVAMVEMEPYTAQSKKAGTVAIATVVRHGVQLVTHIKDRGAASIAFSKVKIATDTLGPVLQFDAANDGSRARKLLLSVDLYDEAGRPVARLTRQRGIVYPGCSVRQAFSLAGLKKGTYSAFVVADAGDDDLFAGTFRIVI
jgi:hypothetical protein